MKESMSRSWPTPTRAAHKKFVEIEGWTLIESVRGNTGDHLRNRLWVGDDALQTRISHLPSAKRTYGPGIWRHTLRDQLRVTESEFWGCVNDGEVPPRSQPPAPPSPSLPIGLVDVLVNRVGLSDTEVRGMSVEEAAERLNRYWAEGS